MSQPENAWRRVVPLLVLAMMAPLRTADAGVPDWLDGQPDTERKSERCGVYEWLLAEADSQTEGAASGDDLAVRRAVNIANKMVERHRAEPMEAYGARIRYLVFGDAGPFHFEFRVGGDELERLLEKGCPE